MKGKLIVIDGSDGVGKETQAKLLAKRLRKEGRDVKTLHFPQYGVNVLGRLINECLAGKHGNFLKVDPHIASVLYAADRFESKQKIEKWLAEGKVVVLDRYVSANQIHQGAKISSTAERKKFLTWLDKLEFDVFGLPRPDVVIFLHMSVPLSMQLLADKPDRDMAEKSAQHQKDAEASAVWLSKTQKGWHRVVCYEAKVLLSRESIHERVWDILKPMI